MEEKKKNRGGKKNVFLIIVALVILIGVGCWYGYYSISSQYFETDNAKVWGSIYQITPTLPGKLVKLSIAQGDPVKANQIIGRVEGGTYVKSPVDGKVIKCDSTINQLVGQTSIIAVIADTSDLYIKANIEETDIGKIKDGESVTVYMDAYPGKKFKAHVTKIDDLTQTALSSNVTSFTTSGTYTKVKQLIPVKITLDDAIALDDIIGTNATVKIKVK